MDRIDILRQEIRPLREELMAHRVYGMVNSLDRLRAFMQHHVFAVWDFMSLLKSLQQLKTGVDVPWLPKPQRTASRLINEIVLAEESDEDGRGGYISHFELYREAMIECGASVEKIDVLTDSIARGEAIDTALKLCDAPVNVADFVRATWSAIRSGKAHCVAAFFTFGREDVIPDMFRRCVSALQPRSGYSLERMRYYLARHIELDEDSHAPMAINFMRELCGDDKLLWQEASDSARAALRSRIKLWDGIVSELEMYLADDPRTVAALSVGGVD